MRVLVVDDEDMARRRLVRLIEAMPDVQMLGTADDGAAALARVAQGDVDVVLLDIHMPGLDGLETLGLLGARCAVVFTTAHADHALPAFDGGAVDYLLKPVDAGRLRVALDRAARRAPPRVDGRLAVSVAGGAVLLDPDDLWAARMDGASVVLQTRSGRLYTALRLVDLERRLPDPPFFRAHRTGLLNLDHVARLVDLQSGGYEAVLPDGSRVEVSRASARALRKRLGLG
jgi:two-component system LytT family response regulator